MSGTDTPEQAGEPAVVEQTAPGEARQVGEQAFPPRHAGGAASGPVVGELAVAGHRHRQRGWIAVVVAVVTAVAVAGADAAGAFHSATPPTVSSSGYGTQTEPVRRGALTEQTQENGTLGDAGLYMVVVPEASPGSGSGSGDGTFTWLPSADQTISQGQMIYQVSGTPVVLLYGNVPAYRDLSEDMTGADVTELNTDLVSLGYASAAALGPRSGWDYFSSETTYALGLLQAHLGVSVTGTLPLGEAVFLPGEIQVTGLGTVAVPGAPATSGAVVLTGTSLTPVVTVDLDASLQTEVAVGNKVSITLPDGATTPGVISQISTAAAASSSSSSSSSGNSSGPSAATIAVVVSLTDPSAAGGLNQVPVDVTITTGGVRSVLIVPVDALLARPGGGYAVEVTSRSGHQLVSVTPGMFDDAAGTVQVTGNLAPGQRVVVPGI
jgi:hypothetical protein